MASQKYSRGFTLLQISILLTVASLVVVATLPASRRTVDDNRISSQKMQNILNAVRQYQTANGRLPCPADPNLATGNTSYGVASSNTGSSSNCSGGSIYAPNSSPNHIAVGMVPVRTLGLSNGDAVDGFNRNITYAVDTGATACWSSPSMQGSVTINDNGVSRSSVIALVSYGTDGYGAWLPLSGTGSGATRLNSGSTDNSQADNAQVARGGGAFSNNSTAASFVSSIPTSTFNDIVAYRSPLYNINTLPISITGISISPPANGSYTLGQTWTFTLSTPYPVTVTGTPYIQLTALSGGNLSAQANYVSGSSTSTSLVFQYTVLASDTAPNGISMGSYVMGTTSPCITYNPPDLSQVIINGQYLWVAEGANNRIVQFTTSGTFVNAFGAGYNGISGTKGTAGSGAGQFSTPEAAIMDNSGHLWVADSGNNRIQEINVNTGAQILSTGSYGQNVGSTSNPGKFYINTQAPQQIVFDSTYSNLWATDLYNGRIQKYNIAGATWTAYVVPSSNYPTGIAIDNSGYIWVSSPGAQTVYRCNSAGASCTACDTTSLASGNTSSDYIAVDGSGYVWVADQNNGKVRKFTSCATAASSITVTNPQGLAINISTGHVWYSDDNNNRVVDYTAGTYISGPGAGTTPTTFNTPQGLSFSR